MLYDVFISYSRKDSDEAEKLCQELEAAGVKYWIDRNIHGSANFLSEITKNIRQCKVVIFIASNNSANSEWTQKEILYALKREKKIIPFRIGKFSFDTNDELDFVFSNVQWLESREQVVRDVCELCGIDYDAPKQKSAKVTREVEDKEVQHLNGRQTDDEFYSSSTKQRWRTSFKWVLVTMCLLLFIGGGAGIYEVSKTKHQQQIEEQIKADSIRVATERAEAERIAAEKAAAERDAKEKTEAERVAKQEAEQKAKEEAAKKKAEAKRLAAQKTYKVGDYYYDGTKEGVVFYVDATGKHGKIVSLTQTKLQWCSTISWQSNVHITVGATSKSDGKANTDKVMARNDRRNYPAFVWCRNRGDEWYLPARSEMAALVLHDSVREKINNTLQNHGASKLLKDDYWTSTEYEDKFAWYILEAKGHAYYEFKSNEFYVRAVAQF